MLSQLPRSGDESVAEVAAGLGMELDAGVAITGAGRREGVGRVEAQGRVDARIGEEVERGADEQVVHRRRLLERQRWAQPRFDAPRCRELGHDDRQWLLILMGVLVHVASQGAILLVVRSPDLPGIASITTLIAR